MPGQPVVFGDSATQRTVNIAFGLVVLWCYCSAVALLFCCYAAAVLLCLSNDHGQSSPVICREITGRQIRRFQK
jgi:hypothetical protein